MSFLSSITQPILGPVVTDVLSGASGSRVPLVVITGTPYAGETLSSPQTGQWNINGVPVAGETGTTFIVPFTVSVGDAIRQAGSTTLTVSATPYALKLQTHRGNNVPVGLYLDAACTQPASVAGHQIAAWRDELSGSGKIFLATGSQKPRLQFYGGVPVVVFDGVDDFMTLAGNAAQTNLSIFMDAKAAGLGNYYWLTFANNNNAIYSGFSSITVNEITPLAAIGVTDTVNFRTYAVIRNSSTVSTATFRDGIAGAAKASFQSTPAGQWVLCSGTSGPVAQAAIAISNLLILPSAVTPTQRGAIDAYIQSLRPALGATQDVQTYAFSSSPSSFSDTGAVDNTGGFPLTSSFARAEYLTDATSFKVTSYNNIASSFPTYTRLGVYVNGVYSESIAPTANGTSEAAFTLPSGTKVISIANGLQSTLGSGGPKGTFLTTIAANAALTQQFPSAANRMLVYGDSISVGGNTTVLMQEAWVLLVRAALYPRSVALEGWGYRALYDDCLDATARAAFVAKVAAYNPSQFWLAIGTNDYGLNKWSAASFGTAYAALLDDLHTALPTLVIYCQSPILRSVETANGSGSTMGNYRTQISTAAAARSSYCTFVDGTSFMTTANIPDGVHPNTAGHALFASAVLGVVAP